MSTSASMLGAHPASGLQRRLGWVPFLLWLASAAIAVLFILVISDASLINGEYVPLGNDSFYHARRILDAAAGDRGFYEFDERIHAPEGSWIPWPWAYDYLMSKAAQLALTIAPGLDVKAFLAYVPPAWTLVNAALFLAAAGALGLSLEMRALAMLSFAISPLTQVLHSVGMIDHHYVEHTFVLLAIWLALRWFRAPHDTGRAALLGIALGIAPSFHNGLFILQLPVLATLFLGWLRDGAPHQRSLNVFAIGLTGATALVLLPSAAFKAGLFEFGLLSWFHLYAAACTSLAAAFMGWHAYSRGSLIGFLSLCAALVLPLSGQLLGGAAFMSGSFSVLDQVTEVKSPYRFAQESGVKFVAGYYSWLLLVAPALLALAVYRLIVEKRLARIYFATASVLGIGLLLSQYRFHYFGFFVFVAGLLLLVDEARARWNLHRGAVFALAFAVIALAYQPALRERLFVVYAPGAEPDYAAARAIFIDLASSCAKEPGVVLADSDDGNAILYHSECSVIANNFILRREDERYLAEIDRLMRLPPQTIRAERPDIKYMLLRAKSFSVPDGDSQRIAAEANPIARELLSDPNPPPGFTLLRSIYRDIDDSGPKNLYARLYKIEPVAPSQSDAR